MSPFEEDDTAAKHRIEHMTGMLRMVEEVSDRRHRRDLRERAAIAVLPAMLRLMMDESRYEVIVSEALNLADVFVEAIIDDEKQEAEVSAALTLAKTGEKK